MNNIKAQNVPLWITIFAIILGLYCAATGVLGLFDPTSVANYSAGADNLAVAWAGRMAATGIVLLLAVYFKSATAYTVALAASIFRELGDALAALSGAAEGFPVAVVFIVLAVDIVAFVLCWRSINE